MSEKFKNKYRIASARLQNWDYGWNAPYFITICTQGKEYFFGDIKKGKMKLSEIGIKAEKYWYEIPEHFPFVILDAFVVMPNHIHGIIIIDKIDDGRNNERNAAHNAGHNVETPKLGVSTNTGGKNKKWKSGTLGTIINQYKRICTINARQINPGFAWQSRFYDRIIRNEKSFYTIKNYIINNPLKWDEDKFNKE